MSACQTIVSPTRINQRAMKHKLVPSVLEPTPDQWAELDAADRGLLARVLREPSEYVDAPALHESGVEKALFGAQASLAGQTTLFAGITSAAGNRYPSTAWESLHFQRFNYARMRRLRLLRQFHQQRMPVDALRLLMAWVHREMDVRNQIVELNMPLVLAMVRQFRRTDLDRNDLVSEGSLALLRCVNTFDWSWGFKFSTYACRAILKSCSRVSLTTGRYRSRFPISYDPAMERSDFRDFRRVDERSMCLEAVREILAGNRARLSVREQTVIDARFMLESNRPVSHRPSLAQVGDRIGVTKERVRQIQNDALRKLRNVLEDTFFQAPGRAEGRAQL